MKEEKIPPKPNHRMEAKWKPRKVRVRKFIDDRVSTDRINFENSFGFTVKDSSIE